MSLRLHDPREVQGTLGEALAKHHRGTL